MSVSMLDKRCLIDAIIGGITVPQGGIDDEYTISTGSGHNPWWEWKRKELEKLSHNKLRILYFSLREVKNEIELIALFYLILEDEIIKEDKMSKHINLYRLYHEITEEMILGWSTKEEILLKIRKTRGLTEKDLSMDTFDPHDFWDGIHKIEEAPHNINEKKIC